MISKVSRPARTATIARKKAGSGPGRRGLITATEIGSGPDRPAVLQAQRSDRPDLPPFSARDLTT